ncbi:M48 family metalloprotease [Streptomyces olivoreticuli]|uniref:M48 family metalloprotease n=1 Tax=Streptomyces olivoreticuli TaxID=68246 RepID=UPI002658F447|nr:M48 family metallopeptidase [Streptomyces olivoreticuli]WKK23434.1 M48 family metalloprotease [Streptomyces olivoreticuli]
MGVSLRALRALVLLAGFYLLGLFVLGVFAGLGFATYQWTSSVIALKLCIVLGLLAIPVVRGMFMLRTPEDDGESGLTVTEAQQPLLWSTVREVAEAAGTRPPDELVLTGDVNAAVSENARLLGLLPGRRRLYIGVPLMTGLTEIQLRAVLAHEFGHYGNADTRLSAITLRGRHSVARTVNAFMERAENRVDKERARQEKAAGKALRKGREAKEVDTRGVGFGYRLMARPFIAYGSFYLRATQSAGRRQELAADRTAARIAGRDAAASALREVAVLGAAHDCYLGDYASAGAPAGLLPPHGQFYGGLRHLLAEPGRQSELDGMRCDLPEAEASPYDAHPPVTERIRLLQALPDDGRATRPPERHALALLHDPERVYADLETATFAPEALAMRRAQWPELVHYGRRARYEEEAGPLRRAAADATGGAPTLRALLDAADAGALWRIAERLPKSEAAGRASGRAAREFVRPSLRRGLARLLVLELVDARLAWWELSWADPARLHLPEGYEELIPAALDAAVADSPDTAPLRALLPQLSAPSPQ